MSTVQCNCEWCKKPFTARTADRKRGWGRFCSKRCKAMKQEKQTGQYRDLCEREMDDELDDGTLGRFENS